VDRTPYPAALRLYAVAEERWAEIDTAYLPTNLLRESPARFCNAVYTWCIARVEEEKREEWDNMLTAPLPGQEDRVTDNVAEEEGMAFMQVMQQTKGA
jgi:hypothetical protein